MGSVTPQLTEEYPPKCSLQKDIYRPFPPLPDKLPGSADVDGTALVTEALHSLTAALEEGDTQQLKDVFLGSQAYWRDLLSFTFHFRTFNDGPIIAPALKKLAKERGLAGGFNLVPGSVHDVSPTPALRWISGFFTFETTRPKSKCEGSVQLFPEQAADGQIKWKIWTLATWLEDYTDWPENQDLLTAPGRKLDDVEHIDTDVLIVGGGNAGLIQAARLKAAGVESVVIDKLARPGDNWATRYDSMRFHIGKSGCNPPFMPYPDELPLILTRDMLAGHMRDFASKFNLNILHSSWLVGSSFNKTKGVWNAKIHTPFGIKTVRAPQLVQATGVGCDHPYIPKLPGKELYKGVASIHSKHYKNPKVLQDKGAKSVIVVGAANSAFDVMEDCAAAGLKTTMIARSPTFIFPWEYALFPEGLGMYEAMPTDVVDKILVPGPAAIGGQLVRDSYANMAATKDKDKYKPLLERGFPVYDSANGGDLIHHLMEAGGKHFNDIGEGIRYIVEGKVAVRGLVQPTAYTETGLELSDGSVVEADAIIWATGFDSDKDRSTTAEVLGSDKFLGNDHGDADSVLGPEDVSALRDGIWGVDKEGELRGMFTRHLRVPNYYIHGGTTTHHRYHSKHVAMLIKADLEGFLPEAYRDTPEPV
ncbi:hypothetical protein KVR01_012790 [Diaporthe batatas]|uniref:uncharacterized protein n=1 Tax=Diaporthe batatas TaxID=748121 RepID=UPI001D059B85|nr:uncharacterized protein KVR01_012790 [Diaporthe batatas]KAG8157406.1 hypothetical protein KVR01_012790 [Diaporthe batatas]